MKRLLARLSILPFIMLVVSAAVFVAIHALPGDPARLMAGPQVPESAIIALRHRLGTDLPLGAQYMYFLVNAFRGDFGISLRDGTPVSTIILQKLPYSLLLGSIAYLLALLVGISGGAFAAAYEGSWADKILTFTTLITASLAGFWVALLGMEVFAVRLHWLPLMGAGDWRHYILPACVLAMLPAAMILRMTRAGVRDVLREDYIRTARAKGVAPWTVISRHALRNAVAPVVTVVALNVGSLISGAVITETVFDWPGIGKLLVDSVRYRDYPVIQSIILLSVLGVLIANLVAEALIALLDPRIRGR